jgi:hypothetical protein
VLKNRVGVCVEVVILIVCLMRRVSVRVAGEFLMGNCLRIEIRRNCRGSFDYREGDLSGGIEISNTTITQILQEIRDKLYEL